MLHTDAMIAQPRPRRGAALGLVSAGNEGDRLSVYKKSSKFELSAVVVVAGVAVAAGSSAIVRIPHSTSEPVMVDVHDTSVGPVNLPLMYPLFRLEYPEHVAAVVPLNVQPRSAMLSAHVKISCPTPSQVTHVLRVARTYRVDVLVPWN